MRASIGIAPNRFLAKVATNMQKPDGLVFLNKNDLPDRLYTLGFGDIPGIGRAMARRLHSAGVTGMEKLLALAPKQARTIWGGVQAALYGVQVEEPNPRAAASAIHMY